MNCATHSQHRIEDTAWQQEELTASQWGTILSITARAFGQRGISPSGQQVIRGGLTKMYRFSELPDDYQNQLRELKERHRVGALSGLLDIRRVETRWVPQREWMSFPESTRTLALQTKEVMRVFYTALDLGIDKKQANLRARGEWYRQFGKPCDESTIRRWERRINERGGFEFAPNEAYCSGLSVPHTAARRHVKLNIPAELIAEFKDRCVKTEHISGAFRSLEIDWMMGREVPGLGINEGRTPFPFKYPQFRPYAPSTAARRQGSHGKARARREALPAMRTTTAQLRRAELYLLDDTRIDIIATDDATGRHVELKSYWLIDVGCRRIEGFVLNEAGNIKATHVDALLARGLRASGIAAPNAGYRTRIHFERGAVACSPARRSFLLGAFPGRLEISATSMDGGRNHPGDFVQDGSGHWMGKAHVESFMRTVAFFLEHIPGQRGGQHRRQPAQLGLVGRNRETNVLDYTRGSRMHEAALLEYSNRALEWLETGDLGGQADQRRLKVSALWPVSWVMEALKEFVAYYNSRTDHRMEGFARIESVNPQTGALESRMESPNERAAALDSICPTERLSPSDASFMLEHTAKTVTVRAGTSKPGVVIDLAPYKGLQFWKPDSVACHEAGLLTTGERKHVALYDAEAVAHWTPESGYVPEIHLLTGKPGKPGNRYLETLPLHAYADRTDETDMARHAAELKKVEQRCTAELLRASTPSLARRMAEARENTTRLQGVISTLGEMRDIAEPSHLVSAVRVGELQAVCDLRAEGVRGSRRAQREAAQPQVTAAEIQSAQDALRKEER